MRQAIASNQVEISLNPYQGLKLIAIFFVAMNIHVEISLNPYQGLKQQNNPKARFWHLAVEISLNPYQGLKHSSGEGMAWVKS